VNFNLSYSMMNARSINSSDPELGASLIPQTSQGPSEPTRSKRLLPVWYGILATSLVLALGVLLMNTFSGDEVADVPAVCSLKVNDVYVLSEERYEDIQKNEHPSVLRAGNERFELMVLGGAHSQISEKFDASFSMYIEPTAARTEFHAFQGRSASELRATAEREGTESYYQALGEASCDKALRVLITKPTLLRDVRSAFVTELKPRLEALSSERASDLADMFSSMMAGSTSYVADDELVFGMTDGAFYFTANGETSAPIQEPLLARAFFGIFTDKTSPASLKDTKLRLADRAPLLWMRGQVDITVTEGTKLSETAPLKLQFQMDKETSKLDFTGVSSQAAENKIGTFSSNVAMYVDDLLLAAVKTASATSFEQAADVIIQASNNARGLRFEMTDEFLASPYVFGVTSAMDARLHELLLSDVERINAAKANFRNALPYRFHKGDVLYVVCDETHKMGFALNDRDFNIVTESSPQLCDALFTAYLGDVSMVESREALIGAL